MSFDVIIAIGTAVASLGAMTLIIKLSIYKANNEQFKNQIAPKFEEFNEKFRLNQQEHIDINDALNKIADTLMLHSKLLDRYSDNESFYTAINQAIKHNIEYLKGMPQAIEFLQFQGDTVKLFSRWLFDTKFENLTEEMIRAKAYELFAEGMNKLERLTSPKFANYYMQKYQFQTDDFITDLVKILNDTINNRSVRYRARALDFLFNINSSFIKEILSAKKINDIEIDDLHLIN